MASIEERALNDKNVKIVNWKDYKNDFLYDEKTNGYFSDIDEMVDSYNLYDKKLPKYAYGCVLEPFSLDYDMVLDIEADDHHEDILDCIDGVEELRNAIENFNKINENIGTYYEDIMTIVELD